MKNEEKLRTPQQRTCIFAHNWKHVHKGFLSSQIPNAEHDRIVPQLDRLFHKVHAYVSIYKYRDVSEVKKKREQRTHNRK
jgi:hypothetical protein